MQIDKGAMWSEIRWSLTDMRGQILSAFEKGSYEAESAALDAIARKISDRVDRRARLPNSVEDQSDG